MNPSYPSNEALHQAYAVKSTEKAPIVPWTAWSEDKEADGSIAITVTLQDGTTETWTRTPSGSTLTKQ